eukprot:UC4_evm1s762
MEASCLTLSMEGERLLKQKDYTGAIEHFEAGLRVGTDDKEVLSAVYNQLGNACFYTGRFHKALEYHTKDLEVAESVEDKAGMAKAYGNLGNTFKSLQNYPNAVKCCEAHLELTKELGNSFGEGRACYNLGNVHHAIGKGLMSKKDLDAVALGRKSIHKAIQYYKTTLEMTARLNDKQGEGRAVGNLGNAYNSLGEYREAIKYHERRLKLAIEARDMAARARACGNLGNAHSAVGEFTEAERYYKNSLNIAKEQSNKAGEGQAYYCLGSTYMMLRNFEKAVEFHLKHLEIAEELKDSVGAVRAWYNLRNAYHKIGDQQNTIVYHTKIQEYNMSKKGVESRGSIPLSDDARASTLQNGDKYENQQNGSGKENSENSNGKVKKKSSIFKRGKKSFRKLFSGKTEGDKNFSISSDKDENAVEAFVAPQNDEDDDDYIPSSISGVQKKKGSSGLVSGRTGNAIARVEARTRAKEKAEAEKSSAKENAMDAPESDPTSSTIPDGDFFDMIARSQKSRLDDQRARGPSSLTDNGDIFQNDLEGTLGDEPLGLDMEEDDEFFDLLLKVQNTRMDNQRGSESGTEKQMSPT